MNESEKEFLIKCFKRYEELKIHLSNKSNNLEKYNLDEISKNIINIYMSNNLNYDIFELTQKFKELYVNSESKIENNESKEEKFGIAEIYDYICNYDFKTKKFNIFTESLIIHMNLYSKCLGKEFGGKLREEQALLFDTNIEVVPPNIAKLEFNKYISETDKLINELDKGDIFEYINGCLKIMVDLIKLQPFADGNKRTFRSLFNLMLKRKNIPPVYIGLEDTDVFSSSLLKAMVNNDYSDLNRLYIRLICDSISLLGLEQKNINRIH
ncbi:MAG: Fic family protein [Clostridium sp.]|nr:Fic family protein [Clostridium sp.]MCM1444128.1 Fic family protein [Candidatus Amulumruptor caecigallinarius]